ncbi:hypothetical protein CJD36_017075 [Flavipsychrobacter stenotrophus]|uniref:DDE transposase family protein n=1 Tax=Flavipsychrobacter stenotrophus TaxID=2077091 RepID=A0A2S7SSF9_9BACT|nr:hypothetical protein [Flavipsychrobacter stenotrophus]PQJ09648.1 hypothetical protein CJD36_017075 [Flavipsychrobacter stenotrophus]
MTTTQLKEQARRLFFQSKLTRPQIAAIVGIAPRTLFDWIREGDWKSARNTAANAPALITEHYYNQLNALNATIKERRDRPYPTKDEAEIMRKLSMTIKQIKLRHSVADTTEIFTLFSNYLRKTKPDLLQHMLNSMSSYLYTLRPDPTKVITNQFEAEQESRADWEALIAELEVQEDLDDIHDTVAKYADQMAQQKEVLL